MNADAPFALVNTIQSNPPALLARLVQRPVVVGRDDVDERRFDGLGAVRFEQLDELAGLFARPRDQHAAAEERPRVEPAQVLAQADDVADDEHAPGPAAPSSRSASASSCSVPVLRLLREQRAVR